MRCFYYRSLLTLLCLLPLAAQANDDDAPSISATEWMERMSESMVALNYRGQFSYRQGDDAPHCFHIIHAMFNNEEYEQLEAIDDISPYLDVSLHDNQPVCAYHNQQTAHLHHQQNGQQQITDKPYKTLEKYYDFTIVGPAEVAHHAAIEITIKPKDTHRYGYRVLLDQETSLPLSTVTHRFQGDTLEQVEFLNLDVDVAIPMAAFYSADNNKNSFAPVENTNYLLAPFWAWEAQWLPQGFTEITSQQVADAADMRSFSDGLAIFSIFMEPANTNEAATDMHSEHGATTAYSTIRLLNERPYRVTIVGEIPHHTAEHVAKSVSWVNL